MYVHYHYNNFINNGEASGTLGEVYSKIKIEQQYQNAKTILHERIHVMIQSQMPSGVKINDKELFDLFKDFETNVLTPAAQRMASKVEMAYLTPVDLAQATQDAEGIQKAITTFTKIARQITNSTFSRNPIPVLTAEMLNGNVSVDTIKEQYRNAYLNDGTTFKVDGSYSQAIASHQQDVNIILANLSALQSIGEGGINSFDPSIRSKTINSLLWSTYKRLNKIIGFVSEENLAEYIPEYIKDSLNLPSGITITTEGTKSSKSFMKKTEDVSISLDLRKMLRGSEGTIQITIPGVSVKRTNSQNQKMSKINIKTNANLGNLLSLAGMSNSADFYNAYADYNMAISALSPSGKVFKYRAQLGRDNAEAMTNMYNYFHASVLPYALGGSLTKGDLAYFIVINNQVLNMGDIIERLINQDGEALIQSNISTKQTGIKNYHNTLFIQNLGYDLDPEKAKNRSNEIQKSINELNITMQLLIALDNI